MDRPKTPPTQTKKEVLTTAEAGEILGVSPDTILTWIEAGDFPGAYKLNPLRRNSPFRIPVEEVRALHAQRRSVA